MRLIYKNARGLAMDLANTPNMTIYNIEGLGPTELSKSVTQLAYSNGDAVNNTARGSRQILINAALHGGPDNDRIRRSLYALLGDREPGEIRYIDDEIDVSCTAYAEAPSLDTWTLTPTIQFAFYCPAAYFRATAATVTDLVQTDPWLQFPLEIEEGGILIGRESVRLPENVIENVGQASTGVKIEVQFKNAVEGLRITNESNGDYLFVDYQFKAGDFLTVTTEIGEKGAILYRDGVNHDIFSAVDYGQEWLRLERGRNLLRYAQGDGQTNSEITLRISFNALYWGV